MPIQMKEERVTIDPSYCCHIYSVLFHWEVSSCMVCTVVGVEGKVPSSVR